jgi:hypothetical protein
MPHLEFSRRDFLLSIQRRADGGMVCKVKAEDFAREKEFDAAKFSEWVGLPPDEAVRQIVEALSLPLAIHQWRRPFLILGNDPRRVVRRFTLQLTDAYLISLPWESVLAKELAASTVVRVSSVQPRTGAISLTLPVRILQVDPAPTYPIREIVHQRFGSTSQDQVDRAVTVRECSFAELSDRTLFVDLPTFEVLHFDNLPTLKTPDLLLSTANPSQPGTLGGILRFADIRQTRLIVINCTDPQQMSAARRLGDAITAKGGPAVLAVSLPQSEAADFFGHWYDAIVHDFPIDVAAPFFPTGTEFSIFAGAGREDLLRVSTIGLNLIELEPKLSADLIQLKSYSPEKPRRVFRGPDVPSPSRQIERMDRVRHLAADLRDKWSDLEFESHEREGLLPMAETLYEIREVAEGLSTGPEESVGIAPYFPPPRFLNSSLWTEGIVGRLEKLDQTSARLAPGQLVHLGIQIGPKDITVKTIGATAFYDEFFKWTPDLEGVWLDIGISGLDFDVTGDPVQEVWLPREGYSEMIYFAITPRVAGAARLRFCVYRGQDVIQSFCFAAWISDSEIPGAERAVSLAAKLGADVSDVGDARYLARLEYSLTDSVRGFFNERSERKVSLVANHLDGDSVITLKGADIYAVETDRSLPDIVTRIREALVGIGRLESPRRYAFGGNGKPNAGSAQALGAGLQKLAKLGWELYSTIVPASERKKLEAALEDEQQIIHAAHVLLDKVIPWAVIYDRQYDANATTDGQGNPVAHETCFAAIPSADGALPATICRQHPACLLHEQKLKERTAAGGPLVLEETVACPLRFWGFKHIIEIPPQEAPKDGSNPFSLRETINSSQLAELVAGFNARLGLATQHLKELDQLVAQPKLAAVWKSKDADRDTLLSRLRAAEPDVVYFYCHARGGVVDPTVSPPCLELQEAAQTAKAGRITAPDFNAKQPWAHHPLVFLNGCGTAAFSPDALSPFIRTFVRDRGAAGIVGTEITIWEQLAGEAAVRFLEAFLDGQTAGKAMLLLRRALLAQNNPLGLAYTLYASADLALHRGAASPANGGEPILDPSAPSGEPAAGD